MAKTNDTYHPTLGNRVEFGVVRGLLLCLKVLPYRLRVNFLGWLMAYVIAPVAGLSNRTRKNLRLILPDLTPVEQQRLVREIARNVGRALAELFSPKEFVDFASQTKLSGPGLDAIDQAKKEGRPIFLVSGHFGNYDVVRAAMIRRGLDVGGLYKRMSNPLFNDYYLRQISQVGKPLFEVGKNRNIQMIRHLKNSGTLAVLIDLRVTSGEKLTFFGHTAWTAPTMAALAVRQNAIMVPCYAIRQSDGLSFKAVFEEPIPHSDPNTMTQALNDSLERRIRENPEQWFWFHRRWKQ